MSSVLATGYAPQDKLSVEGVSKQYGLVTALGPTSLSMANGEFLTLLGPSGSGKTTLLSIVSGLAIPTGGAVFIDGRNVTSDPPSKRGIGMVFQNYALFPHLSIYENIAFPLRMRRLSKKEIDSKVGRVLELVQLSHAAERLPRELSGGQQQRIALARCIVYEPSIVLMDEPLGALDKNLRDHMQTEIKRLHVELGITILYVTHDQEEALAMSDRVCLMNDARIEQIGTAADLYFRPRTAFAAAFLGDSNMAVGKVLEARGGKYGVEVSGGLNLRAKSDVPLSAGTKVKWMVRPECLHLLDDGMSFENETRGQLLDIVFIGGMTKFRIGLGDGLCLTVKELTRGRPMPKIGSEVRVGWSCDHTILLPMEDA